MKMELADICNASVERHQQEKIAAKAKKKEAAYYKKEVILWSALAVVGFFLGAVAEAL